jgi:hypothetical protein
MMPTPPSSPLKFLVRRVLPSTSGLAIRQRLPASWRGQACSQHARAAVQFAPPFARFRSGPRAWPRVQTRPCLHRPLCERPRLLTPGFLAPVRVLLCLRAFPVVRTRRGSGTRVRCWKVDFHFHSAASGWRGSPRWSARAPGSRHTHAGQFVFRINRRLIGYRRDGYRLSTLPTRPDDRGDRHQPRHDCPAETLIDFAAAAFSSVESGAIDRGRKRG